MSASDLILSMEKLLKLHKSLADLAVNKADILKMGDMEALNTTIKAEQNHILAIGKLEEERIRVSRLIIPNLSNPTVSDCLHVLDERDKEMLGNLRDQLSETIHSIKEQNELNQQLLHQSLQFVNYTLSLFTPPEPEDYVYGSPNQHNLPSQSKGMFNSKA